MNTRLNKKVKKDLDAYFKGYSGADPQVHHGIKHILIGALRDANFHSAAQKVQGMFPKAKKAKYYGKREWEDSLEQNHGEPIAKSAKWDGHEIIDAISFWASMFIGGPIGAKITSLKEGMNENFRTFVNQYIKEVTHSYEYEDMSTMGEDENDKEDFRIGNYHTKYFHVCPGASSLYMDIESKGVDMDMAERSARLQDALFFIEEHIQRGGYKPELDYIMVAKNLAKNIMKMAKMMGLEKEHHYIQGHVDIITKVVKERQQSQLEEKVIELTEENVPTNPSKWSYYKSQAKKKFDVYPSAYANAWAAKQYKDAGGGWRTKKKESIDESVNEGISVSDERYFGKKGIIIMIDDNGKKTSAIFKNKKNADKYNRNNPADVKKLLQLAKDKMRPPLKKFPQYIDESVNEAKVIKKNIKDIEDGDVIVTGRNKHFKVDYIDPWRAGGRILVGKDVKTGRKGKMKVKFLTPKGNGRTADDTILMVLKESVNEAKFMDKNKKLKVYDKLKKGDKIRIKFGNAIRKDNETVLVVSKGKTKVGKAQVERIILKNPANPNGVKYYLYNRDGNVSLAKGDMAAVIVDMIPESVNEGKKRYNVMHGVGKSKYVVNYHDGKKKHNDGSDFFDISIFKNKKDLAKKINDLHKGGYKYGFAKSVNEAQKINSPSKKFLKGMKKIKVKGLGGYMPGVDYVYVDGDKYYFVDFEGDHMELKNTNTIKQLHKLHGNSLGESVNEAVKPLKASASFSEVIEEAEYKGRKVKLNKPMQGDSKKFKVYVKNEKGNVVVVHFGQKGMNIKKNNPEARKSFRARMNCDNPGPKWKANYWSCRKW